MHARNCRVCRALRLSFAPRLIDAMFCAIINGNYDADEWSVLLMLAAQMDCEH